MLECTDSGPCSSLRSSTLKTGAARRSTSFTCAGSAGTGERALRVSVDVSIDLVHCQEGNSHSTPRPEVPGEVHSLPSGIHVGVFMNEGLHLSLSPGLRRRETLAAGNNLRRYRRFDSLLIATLQFYELPFGEPVRHVKRNRVEGASLRSPYIGTSQRTGTILPNIS